MPDSAKVRLVRCPKCENLLPELVDYSVYQCGGCGTVLRAKEKNQEEDALSEKSDEEKARQVSSKSGNLMERGVNSSDASDPGTKSNPGPLISSGPRGLEKDDVKNAETGEYKPNKRLLENGLNINMKKDDLSNPIEGQNGDLSCQIGPTSGFRGSERKLDWPNGERGGAEGLKQNPRNNSEGMRFSTSSYLEEGPSNFLSDNFSGFGKLSRDLNHVDGVNKPKYSEQEEKAELLRKLDELRDQLSRSCNMVDKMEEKVPLNDKMNMPNPYSHSSSWYPDDSLLSNRAQMPFYGPEKHVPGPSNFCPDSFPQTNGNDMAMHGYYSSMHNNPNWFSGSSEPLGSHRLTRPPYPFPQSHPYHSGQCIKMNPDPFTRYHPNANFHQPLCSCFHCHEKSQGVSPLPPAFYYNRGFHDVQNNPMLYRPDNSVLCGAGINSKSRTDIPPLSFPKQRSYSRWPSDLNSEIGDFAVSRPRRMVLSSKGRLCQPIAGGAPFFTCYNCFELLKLPKKVGHNIAKNEQKIHCGACSAVIDLAFVDKKLVLPDHLESEKIHKKVGDSPYGHINYSSDNFSSDDYDNSGYVFQSVDRDSAGQGLKPHEMQNLHSSSPSISEDESPEDGLIASREVINNLHQPIKDTLSPPPPGSPLQVYFDYSSNNHNVNRFSKGNRSSRSDQGKAKLNKVTSRQNSLQDVTLATEMDVSFNEYTNAGVTQENVDISREDNQPKVSKGGESFLANIIKKSFGSNQSDERGKGNVSINGKIIPDRAVKKAEKMAGPIHPGKYWYDFRAGFWGVMGGPCLGIIPPCIEEFNHHIPKNCAGGNTGVFVNGRELHQKDLDLLASRGLPILRDKSYIVEISGKVLDEDTGEELDSLGKLAPTVEKVKRGFGMKVLSGSS